MRPDTDIAILGGGCAGLSLAAALSEHAPHLNVHVLEERSRYIRDRTWCFWKTERHPFESCVSHSWYCWRVTSGTATIVRQSSCYPYQHIPADVFYECALQRIAKSSRQVLTTNVKAKSLGFVRDLHRIETDRGTLNAKWVFDSRVPQPDLDKPASGLVQRFTGWHIRTEAECFDPSSIDLMDFESSVTSGRTTFFYILPFNEREALIEVTYLDDPRLVPANSEYDLKRKVDELTRGRYQVLYRERASLPMHCLPARPSQEDGVIRIGRLGGRLKPSSGYAFLRIQRQSKAIAQALGSGESLPTDYEAGFYKVLDHIFLETLERRAADASSYFVPLFQQVPPDTLVRFLGESASLAESFSVVMALPKWPFLRAGLRLLTNKQKINTVALPWRVLVFAAVVAGACTTQAHGTNMTPGLFAAVLVGIAIAIWHGAFDGVLARPILEKPLGRWWIPGFATGYLALAVAVALLWWIEPRFILPVFLLYSAWHFGTEVNPGSLSLASSAVALSVGALPIAAACRWHPVQVTAIFARMLHFSHSELFASHIAHGAGEVLWWATLIAVVGTLLGLRGQGWATCLESLVVIGLELALFWFCDPLLAFGVFFCIWHTPEHLLTSAEDANSRFSKRIMWQQLRSGLLPWLLSLIMLGVFLALEPKHLTAYSSALFILLSALTIPHMLLSEMRRGRV